MAVSVGPHEWSNAFRRLAGCAVPWLHGIVMPASAYASYRPPTIQHLIPADHAPCIGTQVKAVFLRGIAISRSLMTPLSSRFVSPLDG